MSDRYAIVDIETGLYWVGPTSSKQHLRKGSKDVSKLRKTFDKKVIAFEPELAIRLFREYEVHRRTVDATFPKVKLYRIEKIINHHDVEDASPQLADLAISFYREQYGSTFATALTTVADRVDISTLTHAIKRKGSTYLEVNDIPGSYSSGVFTFFDCHRGLFESQLVLNHDNIVKVFELEKHQTEISEL